MGGACGNVERGGREYRILVGKTEIKMPLGRYFWINGQICKSS
jgi:hypothetical protein